MNKRRLLQIILTALALLMPASVCADKGDKSEKVVMEGDFRVEKFPYASRTGENGRGHITVTENHYKITVSSYTASVHEKNESYWESKIPSVTITGQCLVVYDEGTIERVYSVGIPEVSPSQFVIRNSVKSRQITNIGYVSNPFGDGPSPEKNENKYDDSSTMTFECYVMEPTQEDDDIKNLIFYEDSIVHLTFYFLKVIDIRTSSDPHAMTGNQRVELTNKRGKLEGTLTKVRMTPVKDQPIDSAQIDNNITFEEDTDATDGPGPWGYAIPIAVAAAITGILARLRKRKKKQEERERHRQEDEYYDESDFNDEENEENEEPDQLEMRFYKVFGDSLTVGDVAQQIFVCIMRKNSKCPEWTDMELTKQIKAESDDYLIVEDDGIKGDWKAFYIAAPECENPPEECFIKFSLSAEEGTYVNRVHFKVISGMIVFHPKQTTITIPHRYEEVTSVPFMVKGMPIEEIEELNVTINDPNGNVSEDYDVQVESAIEKNNKPFHALITDLVKDDQKYKPMAGKHTNYLLKVVAKSKNGFVIEGERPVFRFYMGLSWEIDDIVGCYLEPYDRPKHQFYAIVERYGKKYVRVHNWAKIQFFDHELKKNRHELVITEPKPEELKLTLKAVDPSAQKIIDNLGLKISGVQKGKKGYYYEIFCDKAALGVPNRYYVEATLTWEHEGKSEVAEQRLLYLVSQPKRCCLTPEEGAAARKRDKELEDELNRLDFDIRLNNKDGELFPLEFDIQMMKKSYHVDYGYSEEAIKELQHVYNKVKEHMATFKKYEADQYNNEYGDHVSFIGARFKDAYYVKKYLESLPWYERLALGIITFGVPEILGSMQEEAMKVGKPGETNLDLWWDVFYVGAEQATISFLVERVLMGGTKVVGAAANTVKGYWTQGLKKAWNSGVGVKELGNLWGGLKNYCRSEVNAFKNWRGAFRLFPDTSQPVQEGLEEVAEATSKLAKAAEMLKKGVKPSKFDKPLKEAKKEAAELVEHLKDVIGKARKSGNPVDIAEMNKVIFEVQGNKFAMMHLNSLGDDFLPTRAIFNETLEKAYKNVDDKMKSIFEEVYGLEKGELMVSGATSSSKLDLLMGHKVTFDRDATYYFFKDGKCYYVDQEFADQVYKSLFYKEYKKVTGSALKIDTSKLSYAELMKLKQLEKEAAKEFGEEMDQTIIEDILKHKESYGTDLSKMIDKGLRHLPLDNPAKVADAIAYKGIERFNRYRSMMAKAGQAATEKEARELEHKALGELVEGCRQEVKQFQILLERNAARFPFNKADMVPSHLKQAINVLRRLTNGESTLDQAELALEMIGYTFDSLAASVGNLAIKIG